MCVRACVCVSVTWHVCTFPARRCVTDLSACCSQFTGQRGFASPPASPALYNCRNKSHCIRIMESNQLVWWHLDEKLHLESIAAAAAAVRFRLPPARLPAFFSFSFPRGLKTPASAVLPHFSICAGGGRQGSSPLCNLPAFPP